MSLKEVFLGSNWDELSTSEKFARISKRADVATILGGLITMGIAPVIALTAIQASLFTGSLGQISEDYLKRRKR